MPNGQPRRSLDPSRARELFGFTAQVPLHEGIARTGRLVPVPAAGLRTSLCGPWGDFSTRPRSALVAIALTILALALPIQQIHTGCAETSSYALVRALSAGTAQHRPLTEQRDLRQVVSSLPIHQQRRPALRS